MDIHSDLPADIIQDLFGDNLSALRYIRRGRCDKRKRLEVLKRDNHACVKCDSTEDLHIHHKLRNGLGVVDEVKHMETLCWSCHDKVHF